jgi:uncharacterized protein
MMHLRYTGNDPIVEPSEGTKNVSAPDTPSTEPFRMPPLLTELNREFWTSGATGTLSIMRCQACGTYLHPPAPVCRACRSREVRYEPVSGRGTVASYSINHQRWSPTATAEPYVVGLVQLAEQDDLRLVTDIVHVDVAKVYIGQPVRVFFQPFDDVVLPLFEPDPDRAG